MFDTVTDLVCDVKNHLTPGNHLTVEDVGHVCFSYEMTDTALTTMCYYIYLLTKSPSENLL